MSTSQGNGGRSSSATTTPVEPIALPPGFDASAVREVATRGRTAAVIPGLADGLMTTLVMKTGVWTHVGANDGQDLKFQKDAKTWANTAGVTVRFGRKVTNPDGTVSRTAWAELADDIVISDETKARIAALAERYQIPAKAEDSAAKDSDLVTA